MFVLLFLMLSVSSECGAQYYVYGGPALAYRRGPVRRAPPSPMEALERLRSPARYIVPQVDYSEEEEEYALPPQWTEDEYEYDPPNFSPPLYAPQDPSAPLSEEDAAYQEMMRSYLMEQQQVQRRSDVTLPTTSSPAPPPQVTGIPPSPEKKSVESLVLSDPLPPRHPPAGAEGGQKEEPLFRPQQTSQRTTQWNDNNNNKTPIPLLKQMIVRPSDQKKDALLEELANLKKN